MALTAIRAASLLDPEAPEAAPGTLLIEGERIEATLAAEDPIPESARIVEHPGAALAPGFLDLHYHGSLVLGAVEAIPGSLRQAASAGLRHGVTGFLPTTVAWPADALMTRAGAFAEASDALDGALGDTVLGIHLEGPWISAGAAGAQPETGIRPYQAAEGEALLDHLEGRCQMVTLAPEVEGRDALLELLARRDVVASLGHSRCDDADVTQAIGGGATHVTHLFNAMGGVHHRSLGLAGRALIDPALSCDLICDGVHVHPDMVGLAAREKGEGLVLITDRIEIPDDGSESFGSGRVIDDGAALRLADGRLAGSSLTMDRAIRNASGFGAMTRLEAIAAATLRPARVLGIERERGTFRRGARADLVVLDAEDRVVETWLGGARVEA